MTRSQLKARSNGGRPVGPVEQRDAIKAKHAEAYQSYASHTAARQKTERAMGSLRRRLDEDDEAPMEAYEQAQADYTSHLAKANAALDRTKALEQELEHLYSTEFETFAREAQCATKAAEIAIEDFLAAHRRAVHVWNAAVEEWAPVCRSVRIPGVMPFPITSHQLSELINGEAVARPTSIQIFEDLPDEVLDAAGLDDD
jgi:hypothetical protein